MTRVSTASIMEVHKELILLVPDGLQLRLIDAFALPPCEYVALSHSWSTSRPLRTTHEILKLHQDKIPLDMLSLNVC